MTKERNFNCVIEGYNGAEKYSEYKATELEVPKTANCLDDGFREYLLYGFVNNPRRLKNPSELKENKHQVEPLALIPGVYFPYFKDAAWAMHKPRTVILGDGRIFVAQEERTSLPEESLEKIIKEAAGLFQEKNQTEYDFAVHNDKYHKLPEPIYQASRRFCPN